MSRRHERNENQTFIHSMENRQARKLLVIMAALTTAVVGGPYYFGHKSDMARDKRLAVVRSEVAQDGFRARDITTINDGAYDLILMFNEGTDGKCNLPVEAKANFDKDGIPTSVSDYKPISETAAVDAFPFTDPASLSIGNHACQSIVLNYHEASNVTPR